MAGIGNDKHWTTTERLETENTMRTLIPTLLTILIGATAALPAQADAARAPVRDFTNLRLDPHCEACRHLHELLMWHLHRDHSAAGARRESERARPPETGHAAELHQHLERLLEHAHGRRPAGGAGDRPERDGQTAPEGEVRRAHDGHAGHEQRHGQEHEQGHGQAATRSRGRQGTSQNGAQRQAEHAHENHGARERHEHLRDRPEADPRQQLHDELTQMLHEHLREMLHQHLRQLLHEHLDARDRQH